MSQETHHTSSSQDLEASFLTEPMTEPETKGGNANVVRAIVILTIAAGSAIAALGDAGPALAGSRWYC